MLIAITDTHAMGCILNACHLSSVVNWASDSIDECHRDAIHTPIWLKHWHGLIPLVLESDPVAEIEGMLVVECEQVTKLVGCIYNAGPISGNWFVAASIAPIGIFTVLILGREYSSRT